MNSIRTRLLLAVLAALVLLVALVGTISYRSVLREAAALFDYHLRQTALSLRDQGEISDDAAAVLSDEQLDMVVQIWRIDGHTVYANRAHRALPSHAVLGYADIDVQGERWRSFGVAAGGRVIQVAQPMRIRQSLATDAALRSVLPLLGAAPVLGAALWALIAYTMRPLERVAGELRDRDAGALAPLAVQGLPDEVAPLVQSLNALLQRLAQAFELQRGFVADAAHELRSPLTALKLQAQLVRRAGDDAARAQALEALVAGVDRATRLTEQLLALARQEPGAASPPLVPTPLAPVLREALAAAQTLGRGARQHAGAGPARWAAAGPRRYCRACRGGAQPAGQRAAIRATGHACPGQRRAAGRPALAARGRRRARHPACRARARAGAIRARQHGQRGCRWSGAPHWQRSGSGHRAPRGAAP
jgi:hypothetical protein